MIEVKKVGENPGFCQEHFITERRYRYVKVTHPKTKEVTWYAASQDWEPDHQIDGSQIREGE